MNKLSLIYRQRSEGRI